MAVRATLTIEGQVQGVWFRGAMQEEAARLGVRGWVRNLPDGSVAADLEGERTAVDTLIAWAHHGPRGARVTRVAIDWHAATGAHRDFAIRR